SVHMYLLPTSPTPFPYTTLFRSEDAPEAWRDTHVRMEGPVVVDVLQAFATTWLEAAGKLLSLSEGPERPPPPPGLPEPVVVSTSDRKSTRLNSSHVKISYAVFCL